MVLCCCGDVKVVENLPHHILAVNVNSQDLKMARLLLIVKILPTGTDVDLDEVVNSIKQNLTDRIELKQYQKEPLAFGLEFIKAQFTLDDAEGQMELLETSMKSTDGVSAVSYTHLTLPTILLV